MDEQKISLKEGENIIQNEIKTLDFSAKSIAKGLLLIILPLLIYIISLLPITIWTIFLLKKLILTNIIHIIFLTLLIIFNFILFVIFEVFLSGIIIRLLRLKIKPGEHDLNIKNPEFFKHILFFTLYRPSLKLISILPMLPLRTKYVKLVGLNIGKNSILAGTELIDEPFSVIIGKNTIIGGLSTIFTHISFKKFIHKPVVIGDNCFIGNKSVIMPGVIIKNNVILKPNSVVKMDQILEENKTYSGNPAEIRENKGEKK